ncbi:MAG: hypothetical protein AAGE94_01705 [Acidobacteriota bacterium]
MKRTLGFTTLAFLLLATLVLAPAATAGPRGLEGSWRATGVVDGTTDATETLFTFSRGGTLIASSDTAANGNGHGTWERIGPRMFAATNVAFAYDANGVAAQVLETEITLEVARGGATFDATFESTVKTLDGTVLLTVTGTASGERIGN